MAQVISIVVGDSRFDIVTFGSLNFSSSDTIVADPSHETNEKRDSLATQPLQSINAFDTTPSSSFCYTNYRRIDLLLLWLVTSLFTDNALLPPLNDSSTLTERFPLTNDGFTLETNTSKLDTCFLERDIHTCTFFYSNFQEFLLHFILRRKKKRKGRRNPIVVLILDR